MQSLLPAPPGNPVPWIAAHLRAKQKQVIVLGSHTKRRVHTFGELCGRLPFVRWAQSRTPSQSAAGWCTQVGVGVGVTAHQVRHGGWASSPVQPQMELITLCLSRGWTIMRLGRWPQESFTTRTPSSISPLGNVGREPRTSEGYEGYEPGVELRPSRRMHHRSRRKMPDRFFIQSSVRPAHSEAVHTRLVAFPARASFQCSLAAPCC